MEGALKGRAGSGPVSGHAMTATPSYWASEAEQQEIRDGTLAGKLFRHQKLQKSMVGWCKFNPGAHTCPLSGFT